MHYKEIQIIGYYPYFAFFGILCVYLFQRLYKYRYSEVRPRISSWLKKGYRSILVVSITSGLLSIFFMVLSVDSDGLVYLILLSCGLISIWYVKPFLRMELRKVPYFKVPVVALVWTLIIVFIPLYQTHSNHIIRESLLFYVYFLALAIPFDIKDIDFDSKNQRTIPQVLGVYWSKMISISLFSIFYVLFAFYHQEIQTDLFYWITLLYSILLIWSVKSKSSEIHFAFIDGSMLLFGLSLMLH